MAQNRIISLVVIAALAIGILFVGGNLLGEKSIAAGLVDGTYEGISDAGMHPGLKVHVDVKGEMIDSIKVVSHDETPGISDPAIQDVPEWIVTAQSTEVDVVSGATMTSNAIKEAVSNALIAEAGVFAPVEITAEDGVYEASSDKGMKPGLKVRVEVKDKKIISVDVIEHEETPGIADPALSDIPANIVSTNNPDVDVISGATFTSEAIIDAVKKALASKPGQAEDSKIPADRVYKDGLYEGSSDKGMHKGLKVEVEIVDGKISNVKVVSHDETPEISDPAIKNIPLAIVEANTPSVDVVSGATYTSEAIIEAVTLAIENAVVDGEIPSEPVPSDTVYKDGVYEGESDLGMHKGLKVSVEVKDGKICDVKVVAHEETEGIADPAIENVPKSIVEWNSPVVDGVSGATYTSDAIKEAVTKALEQAK